MREWAEDLHDRFELARVHVPAVAGDVPSAREHQTRPRLGMVEHGLGRSRRIPVDSSRDKYGERPVASRDRALADLRIVRRPGNNGDASLERIELSDAFLPAHADHLIAASSACCTMYRPSVPEAPR